jgi:hypothetical protein
MKRLPSFVERAERARQRAQRRAELLDQADALRAEIAQAGRDLALVAFGPGGDPRRERAAAQLARLEAAQSAAQLARLLVEADDPDRAGEVAAQLQAALGRWMRASVGWWEARIVWRPRVVITVDKATGQIALDVVLHPFGPYYYRHWRAEGRQQTAYFGRKRPENFPTEEDIAEVPEARPVAPLSALGREALALAHRLQVAYNAAARGQELRKRLRRLLRAAGRRVERRLRAERQGLLSVSGGLLHTTSLAAPGNSGDELSVADEIVHTTFQDAPPVAALPLSDSSEELSVPTEVLHTIHLVVPSLAAVALASPPLTRLSELAEDLHGRSQLGQKAAQEAHSDILEALRSLQSLVTQTAALDAALRRQWAGLPVDRPEDDPQLAEVIALVPRYPAYVALSERAAAQLAQVRGAVRGRALVAWRELVAELRRELRQVAAQVDDLAGRSEAAGVPVQAWIAAAESLDCI